LSQPVISDIEKGIVEASEYVLAISKALGIPPPYLEIEDDDERRLLEAGRALRSKNREVFRAQLQVLEALATNVTQKREI
jgi:hypothetical protein